MNIKQAKELLQRYQAGDVNQSEKELIENWYRQLIETGEWEWSNGEKEQLRKTMECRLLQKIHGSSKPSQGHLPNRKIWWAAAASVTIMLGASAYFLFLKKTTPSLQVVKADTLPDDVQAPQSNKAMVTLANGQKVHLDSINNGALALQGNVKLMKLASGEIVYQSFGEISGQLQYNTLENPKGSKVINMVLVDGTKVWLNAGSSLVYPVVFIGDKRKVAITGEAYFEVAKNPAKPFLVYFETQTGGGGEIEVLGTHFDVNAYSEEPNIKATLLEGSVKIKRQNAVQMLSPGQQAVLTTGGIKLEKNVDVSQVMAWKEGFFLFNNIDIHALMRQVARWYDVDVNFEGDISAEGYTGKISNDVPLSKLLEALQLNGLHASMEGKKINIIR
jgi:ferric-dicitrate binding protein FerR (iron transport regulator)